MEKDRTISFQFGGMAFGGFIMVNVEQFTKEQLNDLAFTQEEIMQLEKARKMPLSFDEACPETTPELALKFKRVNPSRRVANC